MIFKPTTEQNAIVERAKQGTPFKISAFAGAAKTSTLVMVADEMMHDSLYLAYNKRMAVEAQEKFPEWVEVRTTHSLAFGVTGRMIAHKLGRPEGRYQNVAGTPSEIGRYFKMQPIQLDMKNKISSVALGKVIRDTVNNFEYSADREITEKHVVMGSLNKWIKTRKISRDVLIRLTLPAAQKLWKLRTDVTNPVLATHETYLKMYQLTNPDLSQYGTIYLDEAQDSNACILNIVLRQNSQVILVGDHYQSIYQWRGSTNALAQIPADEMNLSSSFRFGDAVASVANLILNASEKVDIKGWDKVNSQLVENEMDMPKPYTKIYRTNAALLCDAVDYLSEGRSVHLEIDFKDLIKSIESAVALKEGRMKDVKHDMFISCIDWDDAKREMEFNNELARIVKMVIDDSYQNVLGVLGSYKRPANPDIFMITAHKSKGLEWDNVVIANDYPDVYNEGKYAWDEQERNLSYVAHTRAKKMLCVGACVTEIEEHAARKHMTGWKEEDSLMVRFAPKVYRPEGEFYQEIRRGTMQLGMVSELEEWIVDAGMENQGEAITEFGESWFDLRPH